MVTRLFRVLYIENTINSVWLIFRPHIKAENSANTEGIKQQNKADVYHILLFRFLTILYTSCMWFHAVA